MTDDSEDDPALSEWIDVILHTLDAAKACLREEIRHRQRELDASMRLTPPPEAEADEWVLSIDITDDARGRPLNRPQWYLRTAYDAYGEAWAALSRFGSLPLEQAYKQSFH